LPGGRIYQGTYIQQGTGHTSHEIPQHCTNSTMVIDKYKTDNRSTMNIYKYNEPKQYTDISKHRRKVKKRKRKQTVTHLIFRAMLTSSEFTKLECTSVFSIFQMISLFSISRIWTHLIFRAMFTSLEFTKLECTSVFSIFQMISPPE
jgi:hypothetical protein